MVGRQFKANILAKIALRPVGSHVLLIAMVILSGICLMTGFIFLWYGKSGWCIPVGLGSIFLLLTLLAWFYSRRDIDLRDASPTQITTTPNGIELSADARSLNSPKQLQRLADILSILSHREPLPEPDGLIDREGTPIVESKAEAVIKVRTMNEDIRKQVSEFANLFVSQDHPESIMQPEFSQEGDSSLSESNIAVSGDESN